MTIVLTSQFLLQHMIILSILTANVFGRTIIPGNQGYSKKIDEVIHLRKQNGRKESLWQFNEKNGHSTNGNLTLHSEHLTPKSSNNVSKGTSKEKNKLTKTVHSKTELGAVLPKNLFTYIPLHRKKHYNTLYLAGNSKHKIILNLTNEPTPKQTKIQRDVTNKARRSQTHEPSINKNQTKYNEEPLKHVKLKKRSIFWSGVEIINQIPQMISELSNFWTNDLLNSLNFNLPSWLGTTKTFYESLSDYFPNINFPPAESYFQQDITDFLSIDEFLKQFPGLTGIWDPDPNGFLSSLLNRNQQLVPLIQATNPLQGEASTLIFRKPDILNYIYNWFG